VSLRTLLARMRTRRWFRPAAHAPMLAYRLGLAPIVGRRFMVLTTSGRRSGEPRHTMVIFRERGGRKLATAAYGERSHWYRNARADPRVTVQTARGTEAMMARPVTNDARRIVVAFEPTSEPTPPGLRADLVWVWPLVAAGVLGVRAARRRS
jgi:deazaflavin-dependent oxidoreductase (nitroreductase family)